MFCRNCGSENADGAQFCTNCGATLNSTPVQPTMQNQNVPTNTDTNQDGNGFAIASLVCGILSFLCFGIILAPLAIVFGCLARSKGCNNGMSLAGIILGAAGLVFLIIGFIIGFAGGLMGSIY